jgi:hypothetical protein
MKLLEALGVWHGILITVTNVHPMVDKESIFGVLALYGK